MKLNDSVKKEVLYIFAGTMVMTAIMLVIFGLLKAFTPLEIPFGIEEILSGLIGAMVAFGNFYFMAVTVQKIADFSDTDRAKKLMTTSFRYRMLAHGVWAVVSFLVPFFNPVAGIAPLFFPSLLIKARAAMVRKSYKPSDETPQ